MYANTFRKTAPTKWLTVTAMLMAVNIAMSSFGIPVPGGHLYLNDDIICIAALLLDPLGAFCVGGIGAFLGDFFFYPAPCSSPWRSTGSRPWSSPWCSTAPTAASGAPPRA